MPTRLLMHSVSATAHHIKIKAPHLNVVRATVSATMLFAAKAASSSTSTSWAGARPGSAPPPPPIYRVVYTTLYRQQRPPAHFSAPQAGCWLLAAALAGHGHTGPHRVAQRAPTREHQQHSMRKHSHTGGELCSRGGGGTVVPAQLTQSSEQLAHNAAPRGWWTS